MEDKKANIIATLTILSLLLVIIAARVYLKLSKPFYLLAGVDISLILAVFCFLAWSPAPVTFVPHLLPLDQGELATCFATLSEPTSKEAVQDLYRQRYADEPFVHVLDGPPNLRAVRDTNECHVYVTVEERGRVMAFSAIDNIWKGASSQGVQNLNLMFGRDESEGL